MSGFFLFILIGLFAAAVPGEIVNQLLVKHSARGFTTTLESYAVFLVILYAISRKLNDRPRRIFFYYLFCGLFGLMTEWTLLGNAGVFFLAHISMFTFWGTMALLPYILLDSRPQITPIRHKIWRFYIPFALIALVPGIFFPSQGTANFGMLVFVAGTPLLNIFYYRYLKISD